MNGGERGAPKGGWEGEGEGREGKGWGGGCFLMISETLVVTIGLCEGCFCGLILLILVFGLLAVLPQSI